MSWFYSGKGLGLGNFINTTPFLKGIADKYGKPVKVYAENLLINFCYEDCDFIDIQDKRPEGNFFGHTKQYIEQRLRRGKYIMPDYEYFYKVIGKKFGLSGSMPHTYIDKPKLKIPLPSEYLVVCNGAGAWKQEYLQKKIIDSGVFKTLYERSQIPVVCLGAIKDLHCASDHDIRGADIRTQLSVLANASEVVTNEGGLAHAAAAMGKKQTIFWKKTDRIKNKNPNKNCRYIYNNYIEKYEQERIL